MIWLNLNQEVTYQIQYQLKFQSSQLNINHHQTKLCKKINNFLKASVKGRFKSLGIHTKNHHK